MSDWIDEEADDPHHADRRNLYKVETWSRDGLRVELMLYAGSSLDKARRIFERTHKHRPRVGLTVRQRMRCWASGRGTKRSADARPRSLSRRGTGAARS